MSFHPEYRKSIRPVLWMLFGLGMTLVLAWLAPPVEMGKGIAGYAPLHLLLETVAVVVSMLVFGICWVAYDKERPGNLILLACVFLGVAMLDFLHALSYTGMPYFVTPSGPEKAINFWLMARALSAIGLLVLALRPWQPMRLSAFRWLWLAVVLCLVAVAGWVGLLHMDWLPHTYVSGQGLTPFKIIAEYMLVVLFLGAALLFLRNMRTAQSYDVVGLFAACCVMAMSEFLFTLYSNLTDVFNLLGHVYKVVGYAFIYKSIFVYNVRLPYQKLHTSNVQLEAQNSERERAEELLRASEERWKFALEGAGDGVWDWDIPSGAMLFSKTYRDMLGYAEGEMENRADEWVASVHPNDWERVQTHLASYLSGQIEHYAIELRLRCKDGSWKWILCRGKVVRYDEQGQALRMIGMHTDITVRKQIEEELRDARDSLEIRVAERTAELSAAKAEAEAASQAKSQFLANMSHDIRTPMNSIIGMSTLALRTELDPKQSDYVWKIQQSSKHLLGIINDILDVSKVEAGKLDLDIRDFSLDQCIDHLSSQLTVIAAGKGLSLSFEVDPGLSRPLRGDPLRLEQVLTNIIGNAIKFTERGSVIVRAKPDETGESDVLVRFEVQDTGIGIRTEHISRLFQAFQQADTSTTRKYGGTGLGLAISKRLVELMQGEVGVESAPGRGSTFWFTVRLKHGVQAPRSQRHASPEGHGTIRGATILLVEDNPFNQQVASELLEQAGARVSIAENGQQALDMLRERLFDCVLMDVQMPVMDGYQATRYIRADPVLAGTPVIAMTANARGEDRAHCREAGMDDFVAKPVDPVALFVTLGKWLGQPSSASSQRVHPGIGYPDTAVGKDVIDLDVLTKMWSGNAEKIRKYALLLVQTLEQDMADIQSAWEGSDLERLATLGHRAKSSAATVGAQTFVEQCLALEKLKQAGTLAEAGQIVDQMQPLLQQIGIRIRRAFP